MLFRFIYITPFKRGFSAFPCHFRLLMNLKIQFRKSLGDCSLRNLHDLQHHTLLSCKENPARHIMKKVMRPEGQHPLVLDERRHIFTRLINIEPFDCLEQ